MRENDLLKPFCTKKVKMVETVKSHFKYLFDLFRAIKLDLFDGKW